MRANPDVSDDFESAATPVAFFSPVGFVGPLARQDATNADVRNVSGWTTHLRAGLMRTTDAAERGILCAQQ